MIPFSGPLLPPFFGRKRGHLSSVIKVGRILIHFTLGIQRERGKESGERGDGESRREGKRRVEVRRQRDTERKEE